MPSAVAPFRDVLELRAELHYKFYHIDQTIADFVLLHRNDPMGPKADCYLKTAAQMAYFNANWDQAADMNKEIIAHRGKSPDLKHQEATRDALWQLQTIAQARGDPVGQLAALESFVARYQSDKAASLKVFQALSLIAEIHATRGNAPAAAHTYTRTLHAFATGGYTKDSGPEATAAAEATVHLLESRAAAFIAADPAENLAAAEKPTTSAARKPTTSPACRPDSQLTKSA